MMKFRRILMMDLLVLFTNPMWLLFATGFPIALILVLGFLASGSYGGTIRSYDYFGVSVMIYFLFNAATFSANSFLEERIRRPNMRIVYSPIPPLFIHLSKVLAATIFCSVTYTAVALLLHLLIGINYGGADCWALILLLISSNLFFSSLGVVVCCILKSESSANSVISLLLTLLAVMGGIFFPVDGMGRAISAISWISPAKWLLVAGMRIIYDGDFSMFLPACLVLVLLAAASVALSARLFKGEEYIA